MAEFNLRVYGRKGNKTIDKFNKIKKHLNAVKGGGYKSRMVLSHIVVETLKDINTKKFKPEKFKLNNKDLEFERLHVANIEQQSINQFKALVEKMNFSREIFFTQGEVFRIAVDRLYKRYCPEIRKEERGL